jgi:hypothetical protein
LEVCGLTSSQSVGVGAKFFQCDRRRTVIHSRIRVRFCPYAVVTTIKMRDPLTYGAAIDVMDHGKMKIKDCTTTTNTN